ncbi:MAG: hypothetical protein ACE5FT_06750 [Candidatus Nanoarchaeia archaeon]
MDPELTFDVSVKKEILAFLNKTVDEENMIVESENLKQRVLTFDGQEISLEEFGGVQIGSEVFIKDNIISLIKLTEGRK